MFPHSSVVKNLPAMQETWIQFLGWEDPLEKGKATHKRKHSCTSLLAQPVKNLPSMLETLVQSLGREDPLEEGMATCSRMLAWRIPMDRERSLAGDGPWCHKESDMTKRLTHTLDMCVWTCLFVCVCVCASQQRHRLPREQHP